MDILGGLLADDDEARTLYTKTLSTREVFLFAVVDGLLTRLEGRSHAHAEAAGAAMKIMETMFKKLVQTEGPQDAFELTSHMVSTLSKRQADDCLNQSRPTDVDLLSQYHNVLREISAFTTRGKQKKWLMDHEQIRENQADDLVHQYRGAVLAEHILAHRLHMSSSTLHQALASSSKRLIALRKSRPSS